MNLKYFLAGILIFCVSAVLAAEAPAPDARTFSDGRLKNVEGVYGAGGREISKLIPVRYRYRKDNGAGIRDSSEHIGLVAQEVQAVIPEAVKSSSKGYLTIDNDPIIFAMLNAIKEQQAEITSLKSKVAAMESRKRAEPIR